MSDQTEALLGTDPVAPDTDADLLNDGQEINAGSSPLAPDSDGDGLLDGADSVLGPPSRITGAVSSGNDLEPNPSFDQASTHRGAAGQSKRLQGRVDFPGDVDVFDVGPVSAGDRITIDFDAGDERFQPAVVLFDSAQALLDRAEDRRERGGGTIAGFIDRVMRHSSDRLFVGVTNPDERRTAGFYTFDLTVTRSASIPAGRAQVVYFDFDGGTLDNPLLGVSSVPAFDPANINPAYAGDLEAMKAGIVTSFLENYAEYNVFLYTSDEVSRPPFDGFSTLLFGSFNASVFGVSESVDAYNIDTCDDGIIFTESFSATAFGFSPPAADLAVAIGNVAAHEVGHLIGLNHVADATAIMDAASPAVFLLEDQSFKIAVLAEQVFPIGLQDEPTLLGEIVGRTSP